MYEYLKKYLEERKNTLIVNMTDTEEFLYLIFEKVEEYSLAYGMVDESLLTDIVEKCYNKVFLRSD